MRLPPRNFYCTPTAAIYASALGQKAPLPGTGQPGYSWSLKRSSAMRTS